MRRLLTILILLTVAFDKSNAAKKEIKEDFINSVYNELIDTSHVRFTLAEKCVQLDFIHKYTGVLKYVDTVSEFGKDISVRVLQELQKKSELDTTIEKWDCSRIARSKCRSMVDVRMFEDGNAAHKSSSQNIAIYVFSRPIYSYDGTYATIESSFPDHHIVYIFMRIDKQWKTVLRKHYVYHYDEGTRILR